MRSTRRSLGSVACVGSVGCVGRLGRIGLLAELLVRDLLRRRMTLFLLFAVPGLFDAIVLSTTKSRSIEVMLGTLVEEGAVDPDSPAAQNPLFVDVFDNGLRTFDQRALSLVFLGGTAVCFLASFLAFYLIHRRTEADWRLVQAGYRTSEVLLSKLAVLTLLVFVLAIYESGAIALFAPLMHLGRVALAFGLGGLVYASVGLLAGALAKRELEGLLLIVLLANVDVGWLQNPAYYETSARRWLIASLPGYHPSQLAILGALTEDYPLSSIGGALGWAFGILALVLYVFWLRVRVARPVPLSEPVFYLRILIVSYLIWLTTFYAVGSYAVTLTTRDLTSSWDRAIPVVPEAVWAYELTYVFPLIALFAIRDWHRFNRALLALCVTCLVAYVCYIAFPIAFPRPVLGTGIADRILATEYAVDFSPGANKLPSLHVAITWVITLASTGQRLGRAGDAALVLTALAISFATLLVKQHIIVDVIAGIVLAFGAHALANRLYARIADSGADPRDALHQLLDARRWRERLSRSRTP